MLVLDFMVKFYIRNYSKAFMFNPWNVLTRMGRRKKKNDAFCTS